MDYGFQKIFVAPMLSGGKIHTIRKERKDKRVPLITEPFRAVINARSKQRQVVFTSETVKVDDIVVNADHSVVINGLERTQNELEQLAKNDGFTDWASCLDWLSKHHGLPFVGFVIHWHVKGMKIAPAFQDWEAKQ